MILPTIPDPRTKLETVVRADTGAFHTEAVYGTSGYDDANTAIAGASTIDKPNPQSYSL